MTATATSDRTHTPISRVLSDLLTALAGREGRFKQRIVEEKLWELFPLHPENPANKAAAPEVAS